MGMKQEMESYTIDPVTFISKTKQAGKKEASSGVAVSVYSKEKNFLSFKGLFFFLEL